MNSLPADARATVSSGARAAQDRDRKLTERECDRVRGTLRLLGVRASDIDDLVQDVQVRLLEHSGSISTRGAWCCAVAANLARDRARREIRWRGLVPRLRTGALDSTDPDLALRAAVRAGLARLPEELRTVAVLRFYADLSVPEIATALGVPDGTVKSRLHRAVSQLRILLPRESVTS